MKLVQQIRISEQAYNYLIQFGTLSYVATRLLYELKDDVIGLPNVRPTARSICKKNNITLNLPSEFDDFLSQLVADASNIQSSPNYVYFSFSRLLEWAAGTEYPTIHNWPVLTSTPRLEFATAAMYTLSNDELDILRDELQNLIETRRN